MVYIWPRLPVGPALEIFETFTLESAPQSALEHPKTYYAPVGNRVSTSFAVATRERILAIAKEHGFPEYGDNHTREQFDLAVTRESANLFPMGWAEAGSAEVWSNIALLLLSDVTWWRWRHTRKLNIERFIASDFTRHTWARLWWRDVQVSHDMWVLKFLGERNTNQFLERRDSVGSSRELISSLTKSLENYRSADTRAPQELVRDATARTLRQMALIDDSALDQIDRSTWTNEIVEASATAIGFEQ